MSKPLQLLSVLIVIGLSITATQAFIADRVTLDGTVVENIKSCCDVTAELMPNETFEHEVVFTNKAEVDQDGNVIVTIIPEGTGLDITFPSPVTVPAGDDLDIVVFIRAKGSIAPVEFTVHTDFDRID